MKVTVATIAVVVPYGDYEYEGHPKLDSIDDILKNICGTRVDYFVCEGRKNGFPAVKVEFNSYSDPKVARKDIKSACKSFVDALNTRGTLVFMEDSEPTE